MAVELVGVLVGAAVGLAGGLGGVFLGHLLVRRREANARGIEGLRTVVVELNRLSRLALYFEQQINIGLKDSDPYSFSSKVFEVAGWKEATHELQEANWRFPCMAYLPTATEDFLELNRMMGFIMDPYSQHPEEEEEMSRDQALETFHQLRAKVQKKVEAKLNTLL